MEIVHDPALSSDVLWCMTNEKEEVYNLYAASKQFDVFRVLPIRAQRQQQQQQQQMAVNCLATGRPSFTWLPLHRINAESMLLRGWNRRRSTRLWVQCWAERGQKFVGARSRIVWDNAAVDDTVGVQYWRRAAAEGPRDAACHLKITLSEFQT